MLFWIIGALTVVLVLDCLFLVLLILVQLPKKEAGLGQAFGGGATDALFGAGSGNALTNMTKYATIIFFVLTLSLSILNAQHSKTRRNSLSQALQQTAREVTALPAGTPIPGATTGAPAVPVVPAPGTPATKAPAPGNLPTPPPVTAPKASAPAPTAPEPTTPVVPPPAENPK
jgi:protein translocase SecG subunit